MTTPTGPIVGTASVAITPSTAGFTPQLQAALTRAMAAVSSAADDMGDAIAREITSGVARAQLALRTLGDGLNERLRVTSTTIETVVGGMLRLGGNATKAGVGIGALGLAAGNAAFALGALLGTMSELSGIAVALPAVLGSAALVMGTLKIATEGVGEAMGAALSGDMEAFSKAMEDLSPSAQAAANTIASLQPRIDKLKTAVQENFFQQLSKSFGDFAVQATQVAEGGLPRIATELGKIGNEFLTQATQSGTFFNGLRTLIDQTVGGLQRWQGVMPAVAEALGNLFRVGSGFAGDLIGGVGNLIAQFAEWINVASQTGELQARLQGALDAFASLGRIIGNVGQIFGAFWFSAQESGANFLGVIENLTAKFATFLNSDAGIESLTALMSAGAAAASILGDVISGLLPVVGQLVMTFSQSLVGALEAVKPGLDALVEGLALFGQEASGGVSSAIGTIAEVLGTLFTAIAPLLPVVGQLVGLLAEHFAVVLQTIAPLVVAFFDALRPMLPLISELVSTVLTAFVEVLGAILTAIMPLVPVLTQLAVKVLTLVAEHFVSIFKAVEPLIPVIIELASQGFEILATVLSSVISALKPLLPILVDVAKEMMSALAPVLPTIAEAFRQIFEALKPVLPVLGQLAGEILVTLATLFTALVRAVAPLLPPLIEIATAILQTLMPAFNSLLAALIPLLPVISDLAVRVLREALLPILIALLPVIPMLVDALIKLLPVFVDLLVPIGELVIQLTPLIVLLTQLAEVILAVAIPPVLLFITVVNELRAIALTLLIIAIDALMVAFKIAWDAIVTQLQISWMIIKGIFDIMISLLQGDFSEAWRRFQRLIGDIWNEISGFITRTLSTILANLKQWGEDLWQAAFNALGAIVGVFNTKLGEMVRSVGDKMGEIIAWFASLGPFIKGIFTNAGTWLFDAGKKVIQGLFDGMKNVAQNIGNWVQDNITNPLKNGFNAAMSIFSPSRWMMGRGKLLMEGLAIGIEDNASQAVNATLNMAEAVKRPVTDTFSDPALNALNLTGMTPATAPVAAAVGATPFTVTFGQGSVVVSFEGVVPSEADALRTGRTVGQGIVDMLARRDAQLAVRVM